MVFMSFLGKLIRSCLRLRYKAVIEGEEIISKYKDTSILFLSNHPAAIDPVIALSFLEPIIKVRPLVAEKFFFNGFTRYFIEKLDGMAVPEFETGYNEYKTYRVEKLTKQIKQALKHKSKILLYPAGKLQSGPYEKIGGASLAFTVKDDAKVLIGISIDGLYGSMFSRYFEKKTPNFVGTLIRGAKIALANGLFFLPKREVRIQLFELDPDLKKIDDKNLFNEKLEKQLNSHLKKPFSVVSYGRVKAPKLKEKDAAQEHAVDLKLLQSLQQLAEKVTKKTIPYDAHLSFDAGLDSLELSELLVACEARFSKKIYDLPQTLRELGAMIEDEEKEEIQLTFKIHDISEGKCELLDKTHVLKAFYDHADLCPNRQFLYDERMGSFNYKKARLVIGLLAKQICAMEGKFIALMLPSSVMAYLLYFATLEAGKVPVMLNWTAGGMSLDHAIKLLEIKHIISSSAFLEKAFNVELKEHFDKVVVLENLKQNISFVDKLAGSIKAVLKKRPVINIAPNDPCVILFTSGSEALPKAVPLSHENILSNIDAAIKTNLVKPNDRFLASLPPFHSFGCVITGILPVICGIDTVFSPDPTDAMMLLEKIKNYDCSLFCSAPSFLKQILTLAEVGDLESLRLAVVGAEKCPDSLKKLYNTKCKNSLLLEGYGITECSPIVTIQRSPLSLGVGEPLKGIEIKIIDPDSCTELGIDQVGEIIVSAKSVFSGYLGVKKDPFIEIDNKIWYRTGDRGILTKKHELVLQGRYKRFVKIGAEMISLSSLEEALEDFGPQKEGVPRFAAFGDGASGRLTLFAIFSNLNVDDVNQHLRNKGLPKVAKFSEIRFIDAIPQLASGKIDYKKLEHENI
jgi:long-chain-fatty-acid--[acyl-carrier-protein] ligase